MLSVAIFNHQCQYKPKNRIDKSVSEEKSTQNLFTVRFFVIISRLLGMENVRNGVEHVTPLGFDISIRLVVGE